MCQKANGDISFLYCGIWDPCLVQGQEFIDRISFVIIGQKRKHTSLLGAGLGQLGMMPQYGSH